MGRSTPTATTMLAAAALLHLAGQATALTTDDQASALKQYTSHGHVLGFDMSGYYVSNGTYALRVSFDDAAAVAPSSDDAAGEASDQQKAAPLGRVTYSGVWKGISVTYDAPSSGIARSTWTLDPGADPAAIRLRYNRAVELGETGELGIPVETGALTESRPVAWQDVQGEHHAVEVEFVQLADEVVGFRLGAYRIDLPLTIDPTLTWNTFLGGSGADVGNAIAVDSSGNVYVGGYSTATWGSPARAYTSGYDAFAAKLTSAGALIWNTFLGGSGIDFGNAIAVDGSGNVYVSGQSDATWGSPLSAYTASDDAFAAKLTPAGTLTWSTFIGGSGIDRGYAIAVDGSGNVYVGGHSHPASSADVFVAKLTPAGALTWNTVFGGGGLDFGFAIAVDGSGNVYVSGTSSATWGSPVRAYTALSDVFVAKLTSGGAVSWNTFLGGSGDDAGRAIAADASGNVHVGGYSGATWGNPVRPYTSGYDVFAAQLTSAGTLTWSTFLGGIGDDFGNAIAVDASGNVYISGYSTATWGSPVSAYTAPDEAFAGKLTSAGSLTWNTFLGGSANDYAFGIAVDGVGNVYAGGNSGGTWGIPVRAYTASFDVFVALIAPDCSDPASFESASQYAGANSPVVVAVGDLNGDAQPDAAAANSGSNNVSVWLGNGSGFGAATSYSVGSVPWGVAIADFNADSKLDLLVSNESSNSVSVLLGNGNGTFGAATSFPTGTGPKGLGVGDFNGDNKLDAATANDGSHDVSILLGNGNGGFLAATNLPSAGSAAQAIAVADLNVDNKLDLAVVYNSSNIVSVVLGNGNGTFGSATNFAVGSAPRSVVARDLNGDAKLDLVVGNQTSNDVSVLLGNGSGGFAPATSYAAGSAPFGVAVADFDTDGALDVAVANRLGNSVSILHGSGTGSFAAPINFAVGSGPLVLATLDVNDDDAPDMVASEQTSNDIAVLINQLSCAIPTATPTATPTNTPTPSSCGNNTIDLGEGCDDGNTQNGDCCSSTCQFETAGSPCASDGNVCTLDQCNGGGACTHQAGNAAVPCRTAAGVCDVAELCTGASSVCPSDGFQPSSTVCRSALGGGCDIAENCTGSSASCPADAFVSSGTPCATDGSICTTDQCNGSGACAHTDNGSCETTSANVPPGGTITTDPENDGATPSDPIETTITSPTGGTISIEERPTASSPSAYFLYARETQITAPPATAGNPLVISFRLDASILLPQPFTQAHINVGYPFIIKDGNIVANCTGPAGVASPDPCVASRVLQGDGDVIVTVRTSTASLWQFGIPSGNCPDTVDNGCIGGFTRALLLVKENVPGKEKLVAKLGGGPALVQTELGNPLDGAEGGTGTVVSLCIYADTGDLAGELIAAGPTSACAGAPCWESLGNAPNDPDGPGKGYAYKDAGGNTAGLQKLLYKGGDAGKPKAIIKAKGSNLPTGIPAALQSSTQATIQLRSSDGECLTATVGDVQKQEAGYFKAK